MYRGIGVSKGIGIGNVLVVNNEEIVVDVYKVDNVSEEKAHFDAALKELTRKTEAIIEELYREGKKDSADILQGQLYFLSDPSLISGVHNIIENDKVCASAAVDDTFHFYYRMLMSAEDEVTKQRAYDVMDLRNRLLKIIMGIEDVPLGNLKPNTIIVAKELSPSVTAVMDTKNVSGIVTENGGETSHVAILAKALDIPAVLSVKKICRNIKNNDIVIVDGILGEVYVNASDSTVELFQKKRLEYIEKKTELNRYAGKETVTADGKTVLLYGNVGTIDDIKRVMEMDAEGVGLFRTEFLFMNRSVLPTEEEQFEIYKRAAIMLKNKELIIRTLDIGGDKDIPYLGMKKENNPFLGFRAIRYCLKNNEIFTGQLRAILRASAYGNVKIMIPLVTTVDEVVAVKKLLHKIQKELREENIEFNDRISLGVMMETPAAGMISDIIAKEVDFFSIGTNDLIQYTMAVDRGNENVAYLYSQYNPAVLRMIATIIKNAKENNIPVGMCGEAASDARMIPVLLGFGLDEFSVTSSMVLETRKNIARWSSEECSEMAQVVLGLSTAKEVVKYLDAKINGTVTRK